jgi:predicted HicB family RNase H-like nuclease
MSYSPAQKRAIEKYLNERTDDIRIRAPRGLKEKWREAATKRGISMTQFVIACVDKELSEDNKED